MESQSGPERLFFGYAMAASLKLALVRTHIHEINP
jgi:hypothetical protein